MTKKTDYNQTEFLCGCGVTITPSIKDKERKQKKSDNLFLLCIAFIVMLMLVVVLLNTYVFINVQVKGPSMQPTLYSNDMLVANKHKEPQKGSIVIIKDEKPGSSDWLIKRVIATGGDYVKIESGFVFVNGKLLDEPYTKGKTQPIAWEGERMIGENEFFYLGDNRENSSDSRTAGFGTCKREQIVGVVENWSLYLCKIFR